MGYAARFSADIAADLARGYSFAGWGVVAYPSREAGAAEYADYGYNEPWDWAYCATASGWLPRERGLSAFYAEDAEDAVTTALRHAWRFAGSQLLYVFPARFLATDAVAADEWGTGELVAPTGPPRLIER